MAIGMILEKWLAFKERFVGEPWVWMHPAMKARGDADVGDEAPLTHLRIGSPDAPLWEIHVDDRLPDGVVFVDRHHLGVEAILMGLRDDQT